MELAGVRFGRLVAKSRTTKGARVAWLCYCDCGDETVKAQVDLRSGDTTSCGCVKRTALAKRNTSHGMSGTVAYNKWRGMWARVRNPHRKENQCYADVTVCKRWERFENFFADMGEPPTGYSLDRINNTRGYSQANCRWVPLAEQARNTRRIRMYKGKPLSQAAREAGLAPDVVFDRVNKLGWSVPRALSTPTRKINRNAGNS